MCVSSFYAAVFYHDRNRSVTVAVVLCSCGVRNMHSCRTSCRSSNTSSTRNKNSKLKSCWAGVPLLASKAGPIVYFTDSGKNCMTLPSLLGPGPECWTQNLHPKPETSRLGGSNTLMMTGEMGMLVLMVIMAVMTVMMVVTSLPCFGLA